MIAAHRGQPDRARALAEAASDHNRPVAEAAAFAAEILAASGRPEGVDGAWPTAHSDNPALARILDGLMRRVGARIGGWVVHRSGRWVRDPEGRTVDLSSQGAPARILAALAQAPPGAGIGVEGLFAAGWPAQRALPSAQRNRVHVALSTLRKAGLRAVLVRVDGGWALDWDQGIDLDGEGID